MKKVVIAVAVILGIALVVGPVSAQTAPSKVVLKGSPLGGVNFDHAKHAKLAGGDAKCDMCHHASKPEKPLKSKTQKCQECHTKAVAAPMKTNARGAFHDAMAKKGLCADCHVKSAAAGTKVPAKCADCHNVKG